MKPKLFYCKQCGMRVVGNRETKKQMHGMCNGCNYYAKTHHISDEERNTQIALLAFSIISTAVIALVLWIK